MKILFLAPYPLEVAPSQRYRFEHFLKNMEEQRLHWTFQPFFSTKAWNLLYQQGTNHYKVFYTLLGYLKRVKILLKAPEYEFIHIHRELTPFGPPVFEWIIAFIFRKKIIYDFDDAIWLNDGHDSKLSWTLKARWKIAKICSWSYKVSVGNEYLADFASTYNPLTVVIPTVVDTSVHAPQHNDRPDMITIGWTGSHSTLPYLRPLVSVLQTLYESTPFQFLVIANKDPRLPLKNYRFIKWNKEKEIEDLRKIDIGVMPLPEVEWAKGKCGFKLIQYMSLALPTVASQVGVNGQLVEHGKNGYLAKTPTEWLTFLKLLSENTKLRSEMGMSGRMKVESEYSTNAVRNKFLGLFT